MLTGNKLGKVLVAMNPATEDEWESLREALQLAESFSEVGGSRNDFAMVASGETGRAFSPTKPHLLPRTGEILEELPKDHRAYFYAFLEALDIYQSIHGHRVTPESLRATTVVELRKIRDLCLRRGLRSF